MDSLERDQDYFRALFESDAYFAQITVLAETKGDTEAGILQKLSTINKKDGRIGAVVVILQPELIPSDADTPGPEYRVQVSVQVIEDRLTNRTAAGTGRTSWEIAERVRQVGHRRNFGDGTYVFAGLVPVPQQVTTRDSVVLTFRRLSRDEVLPKSSLPLIDPEGGALPAAVTLEGAPGAALYYSLDGSYPSLPYAGAITITTACTLRAVAIEPGKLPSDFASATFA